MTMTFLICERVAIHDPALIGFNVEKDSSLERMKIQRDIGAGLE
ncbi:MAG: hypothetical protein ACJA1A_002470 [Saprospiraceae bacterium]|jgi:hypothetical protein